MTTFRTFCPFSSLGFVLRGLAVYSLAFSLAALMILVPRVAGAQTTVNSSSTQLPSSAGSGSGSASSMWGAGSGGGGASSSLSDSANAHDTLGQSAALVQSAKRGFLYSSGTSIIFESVGSQSIVSTSIYGDNNVANINANQTSTNNGSVNAIGSISLSGNATTTTTVPPGGTTGTTSTSGTPTSANGAPSGKAPTGSTTAGKTTGMSTTVGAPPASSGPSGS
ncbi:MAG: hypothetical protein WDM77_01685 [Steroidobacteraceae bacterium]